MQSLLDSYRIAFLEDDRYLFYLNGLKITIAISFFAILIGVSIGICIALITAFSKQYQKDKPKTVWQWIIKGLNSICNAYVAIIRGTPVMVQLLILYNWIFTARQTNEILIGAICFGINSGAYVAEIMRAGIFSIDHGQREAGCSLGFTYLQTMRWIILPQAIKNILPALGNEFIVLIKETSVVGVIAVTDLTKAAQYVGSRTYDILPPLLITALIYFILVVGLTKMLQMIERRVFQHD